MIVRKYVDDVIRIFAASSEIETIICDGCKKEIVATKESGLVPYYEVDTCKQEYHFCSDECCISKLHSFIGNQGDIRIREMFKQPYKSVGDVKNINIANTPGLYKKISETCYGWEPNGINTLASQASGCTSVPITGNFDRVIIPYMKGDPHDIDGFPTKSDMTPNNIISFCKEKIDAPLGMTSYFAILLNYYYQSYINSSLHTNYILVSHLPTTKDLLECIENDHGLTKKILDYFNMEYDTFQELPATKTNKIYEIEAVVRHGNRKKKFLYTSIKKGCNK